MIALSSDVRASALACDTVTHVVCDHPECLCSIKILAGRCHSDGSPGQEFLSGLVVMNVHTNAAHVILDAQILMRPSDLPALTRAFESIDVKAELCGVNDETVVTVWCELAPSDGQVVLVVEKVSVDLRLLISASVLRGVLNSINLKFVALNALMEGLVSS